MSTPIYSTQGRHFATPKVFFKPKIEREAKTIATLFDSSEDVEEK